MAEDYRLLSYRRRTDRRGQQNVGRNLEGDIFQYRGVIVIVAERHIFIGYKSVHIAEGLSTRFILIVGLVSMTSRNRRNPEKPSESSLQVRRESESADKDSDIESVHSKICRIHLTVGNKDNRRISRVTRYIMP